MASDKDKSQTAGRRVALIVAGTGVLWVLANLLGSEYGWSARTQAVFDLAALAGFGAAFWVAIGLWRARKH